MNFLVDNTLTNYLVLTPHRKIKIGKKRNVHNYFNVYSYYLYIWTKSVIIPIPIRLRTSYLPLSNMTPSWRNQYSSCVLRSRSGFDLPCTFFTPFFTFYWTLGKVFFRPRAEQYFFLEPASKYKQSKENKLQNLRQKSNIKNRIMAHRSQCHNIFISP